MIDKGILEKKYKSDDKENEAVKKQIDQIKQNYGSNGSTYKSVLQRVILEYLRKMNLKIC